MKTDFLVSSHCKERRRGGLPCSVSRDGWTGSGIKFLCTHTHIATGSEEISANIQPRGFHTMFFLPERNESFKFR